MGAPSWVCAQSERAERSRFRLRELLGLPAIRRRESNRDCALLEQWAGREVRGGKGRKIEKVYVV
jgi:hypothetical protein